MTEEKQTLADQLEALIQGHGRFVNGYFLVYEGIDEDGERILHYVYPEEQTHWNTLGMLHTAIQAANVAVMDEDDDE